MTKLSRFNNPQVYGVFLSLLGCLILFFITKNNALFVSAVFGSLLFYYHKKTTGFQGTKSVSIYGVITLVSYFLIGYFQHSPLVMILFFAITAFLSKYLAKLNTVSKTGPFFIMMIISLSGTSKVNNLDNLLTQTGYLATGVLVAIIVSFILDLVLPNVSNVSDKLFVKPLNIRLIHISGKYMVFMTLAFTINLFFPIHEYNWLTISCAANMFSPSVHEQIIHTKNYVIGSAIGLGLVLLLGFLSISPTVELILICLIYLGIVFAFQINYAYVIAITTPMALLIIHFITNVPAEQLVPLRLLSILIGITIGFIGQRYIDKSEEAHTI